MAVFLTKNAPGLRTSPVKRGYWVVRRLLGEHIPAPPPNVPGLPTDETKLGDLTLRETLAQHRANPELRRLPRAVRLVRPGLRRLRAGRRAARRDLAGRAGRNRAPRSPTAARGPGSRGCARSCAHEGRDEFVDNLCRKLLAYALGRSLLRSDEPLLAEMRKDLAADGYRFGSLVRGHRHQPAVPDETRDAQLCRDLHHDDDDQPAASQLA